MTDQSLPCPHVTQLVGVRAAFMKAAPVLARRRLLPDVQITLVHSRHHCHAEMSGVDSLPAWRGPR